MCQCVSECVVGCSGERERENEVANDHLLSVGPQVLTESDQGLKNVLREHPLVKPRRPSFNF